MTDILIMLVIALVFYFSVQSAFNDRIDVLKYELDVLHKRLTQVDNRVTDLHWRPKAETLIAEHKKLTGREENLSYYQGIDSGYIRVRGGTLGNYWYEDITVSEFERNVIEPLRKLATNLRVVK